MCAGPASELSSSQGTQSSVFSSSSSPSPFRRVEWCASDSLQSSVRLHLVFLFVHLTVFSSSSSRFPFRPVEWCASDSLQSSVRPHLLLLFVQWSGVHLTVFSLQSSVRPHLLLFVHLTVFSSSSSPSPFRPEEQCASDSLQSSVRPHLVLPFVQWSGVHLTVFSLQFVLISFSFSSRGAVCIWQSSVFSSSSSCSPFRPVEWCASDSLQSSVRPHLLLLFVQWSGVHLILQSFLRVPPRFSVFSWWWFQCCYEKQIAPCPALTTLLEEGNIHQLDWHLCWKRIASTSCTDNLVGRGQYPLAGLTTLLEEDNIH